VTCNILSRDLNCAGTWTPRKIDQKYLQILKFEIWCCRSMEKSNCTIPMRNEEMLRGFKAERNILHSIKRRNANWIGHNLRRNCLLKHDIQGKVEGMGGEGRRRKQLLNDLKEKRGYWKLNEEALYRPVPKTRFGRGYGPVVRKTA